MDAQAGASSTVSPGRASARPPRARRGPWPQSRCWRPRSRGHRARVAPAPRRSRPGRGRSAPRRAAGRAPERPGRRTSRPWPARRRPTRPSRRPTARRRRRAGWWPWSRRRSATPPTSATSGDPVRVGAERAQPGAHGAGGDAVRAGQRGGGQRVGHACAARVRARTSSSGRRARLGGGRAARRRRRGRPARRRRRRACPDRGHAQGEPDRPAAFCHVGRRGPAARSPGRRRCRRRRARALVDAALGRGVRVDRAVPVEVVVGDVEHRGGLRRASRADPVQLEARQLDGQHVVRAAGRSPPRARRADVARGHGADARRRCSIEASIRTVVVLPLVPVSASHGAGPVGRPQPPGQLDLAPDGDAGGGGLREQRVVGPPARRGDDQVEPAGQRRLAAEPSRGAPRASSQPAPPRRGPRSESRRVDHGDLGAAGQQRVGRGERRRPRARRRRPRGRAHVGVRGRRGRRRSPPSLRRRPTRRRTRPGPAATNSPAMIQNRMTIVTSAQPEQLEVVLQRRHPEHPFPGELERADLDDHRQR